MADYSENIDEIFDEYESIDQENNEQAENETTNDGEEKPPERVAPPKRIVKNPRLKFDAARLCGARGIPVLIDHFKNVKFKGKGHEKEDLSKLMSHLEHWCHRLFPSMKFADCLHQIEKLGAKRPVKFCLYQIRRDMVVLKESDNEEDGVLREGDGHLAGDVSLDDRFDSLLDHDKDNEPFDSLLDRDKDDGPLGNPSLPQSPPRAEQRLGSSFGSSLLSDEQKERIEYNKRLAVEKRKARLAASDSSNNNNQQQYSATQNEISEDSDIFEVRPKSPRENSADQREKPISDSVISITGSQKSTKIWEKFSASSTKDGDTISSEDGSFNQLDSDKASLDELMDLVDDESGMPSVSNTAKKDVGFSPKKIEMLDVDELGLDDLVDLVDDDEIINSPSRNECSSVVSTHDADKSFSLDDKFRRKSVEIDDGDEIERGENVAVVSRKRKRCAVIDSDSE